MIGRPTRIQSICVPFHLATTAQLRAGELAENDVAPRSDKRQLPLADTIESSKDECYLVV